MCNNCADRVNCPWFCDDPDNEECVYDAMAEMAETTKKA